MSQYKLFDGPISAEALLGGAGSSVSGSRADTNEAGNPHKSSQGAPQPVPPKGAIVTCMCGWSKTYANTWAGSWGAITHQRFCPLVLEGLSWLTR